MNHIEVQSIQTPYGYKEKFWVIDGKALPEYLNMWASESQDAYLKLIDSFFGLCPAWSKELDFKGDIRFVWKLVGMDSAVLPLLLCADDLDFSCIVIVVEVEKTKDFVYWRRIGYVLHENEDFEEELYRRRMNYTLPYYETEGNVCWFQDLNLCFARKEYESMARDFWDRTTLEYLQNILKQDDSRKLTVEESAHLIAEMTLVGRVLLQEHIKDYNEILLHLFATDMVNSDMVFPLGAWLDEQVENGSLSRETYEKICWKNAQRVFGL